MEPIAKICNLCQNNLLESEKHIQFSCSHKLCMCCFPYVIYRRLLTNGFQSSFFEDNRKEFECLVCQKTDKINISTEEMINAYKKCFEFKKSKIGNEEKLICEACLENPAILCCLGCQNQNYCEACLTEIHKKNKKITDHKIMKLNEKSTLSDIPKMACKIPCNCPSKRMMESYCHECKRAICIYCLKAENHETHKLSSLKDIYERVKSLDQDEICCFLQKSTNDFEKFQRQSMNSYEKGVSQSIEEINATVDSIIKKLQKLQNSIIKSLHEQVRTTKNNFIFIQLSLALMEKELESEKIMNLHPNKIPLFLDFFSRENFNLQPPFHGLQDLKVSSVKNYNLEEIEIILDCEILNKKSMFLLDKDHCKIKITKNDENFLNLDEINFPTEPKKILLRKPLIIEEGTFRPRWFKSNVSTAFILGGETFLIWPGYNDQCYFIHVYNLSTMKKEIIIQGGEITSMITVLSHYPKRNIERDLQVLHKNKRFLFWADEFGIFSVFGLSKQDKFKEILKIQTKLKAGIISAVVFEDLYSELNPKDTRMDNDSYVILSFEDDDLPLQMHKLEGENAGMVVKRIPNHAKNNV